MIDGNIKVPFEGKPLYESHKVLKVDKSLFEHEMWSLILSSGIDVRDERNVDIYKCPGSKFTLSAFLTN